MMKASLDYLRTVQPAAGLVREFSLLAPDGQNRLLWTMLADIGQQDFSGERLTNEDYRLTYVGACSTQRVDAFVRGCGEAVERSALLPRAALLDDLSAPAMSGGPLWRVPAGEWDGDMYAATNYTTEARVRVPAPAVDYPVPDPDALKKFDFTPSGAAAGPSYDAAVASAMKEILERDAAMLAWTRQARLPRLDLTALAAAGNADSAQLARLLKAARSAEVEIVAVTIPTSQPDVDCAMGIALDRQAGAAAAGLAAGAKPVQTAAKAVQEALQVRAVLLAVAKHYDGTAVPDHIVSDLDRARRWATPAGVEAMDAWIDTLGPLTVKGVVRTGAPARHDQWAEAAVVNLTPRLPPAVQKLGWHAVKVLSTAHQPLRMNELLDWSWHEERLAAPEREWGVDCAAPTGSVGAGPHPFI